LGRFNSPDGRNNYSPPVVFIEVNVWHRNCVIIYKKRKGHHMRLLTSLFIVLLFSALAMAQDTTRTQDPDRDNYQGREQKQPKWDQQAQKQKQERANRAITTEIADQSDQFVDEDGDGINDTEMLRFQKRIREGVQGTPNESAGTQQTRRQLNKSDGSSGLGTAGTVDGSKSGQRKSEAKKGKN
jgi:hypothetical protein